MHGLVRFVSDALPPFQIAFFRSTLGGCDDYHKDTVAYGDEPDHCYLHGHLSWGFLCISGDLGMAADWVIDAALDDLDWPFWHRGANDA